VASVGPAEVEVAPLDVVVLDGADVDGVVAAADEVVVAVVGVEMTAGTGAMSAGTASKSAHFGGAAEATTTMPDHPIATAAATAKASLGIRIRRTSTTRAVPSPPPPQYRGHLEGRHM
jgi:hypothetical protein